MLKSFAHFNETVFRGPDDECGSGGDGGIEPDVGGGEGLEPDGGSGGEPEPKEPLTVREQIKRSIAETSEQPEAKPKRDAKTGRFGDRAPKAGQEPAAAAPEAKPAAPAVAPPASLPKEVAAEWEK